VKFTKSQSKQTQTPLFLNPTRTFATLAEKPYFSIHTPQETLSRRVYNHTFTENEM